MLVIDVCTTVQQGLSAVRIGPIIVFRQAELVTLRIGEDEPSLAEFLVWGCGQSTCSQRFKAANRGSEVINQQI